MNAALLLAFSLIWGPVPPPLGLPACLPACLAAPTCKVVPRVLLVVSLHQPVPCDLGNHAGSSDAQALAVALHHWPCALGVKSLATEGGEGGVCRGAYRFEGRGVVVCGGAEEPGRVPIMGELKLKTGQ